MLKTLDNSLQVLEHFTKEHPRWGVRELAKELGMSHSIVYRVLATFEKHGFLIQDPATQKYRLGLKLLEYGSIIRDSFKITDVIYPVMAEIAEATGESIFLTWLDGYEGICIEIAESQQKIKYALSVGSRTPLYAGASNKVIMAYLPVEAQAAIIAKGLKPKTDKVITAETLLAGLKKIRRDGWAYSTGEYSEATFGIAVPLFAANKQIIASLTAAGPEFRMPEEKVQQTLVVLRKGRDKIQDLLDRHIMINPFP